MKRSQILLCHHKPCKLPQSDLYRVVLAGRKLASENLLAQMNGVEGDDSGENISAKNRNYCELSVQYWGWKQGIDADYVGLCHYRRYFDFTGIGCVANISGAIEPLERFTQSDVAAAMEGYDVVLTEKFSMKYSMKRLYKRHHNSNDLRALRDVLEDFEPQYLDAFDDYMSDNKFTYCNMFVMGKELFERYSEWLFRILFEVEKRVDVSGRDDYQSRVFGFLGERLISIYCNHNKLRINYLPIIKVESKGARLVSTKRKFVLGIIQYYKVRTWYTEFGQFSHRTYYLLGIPFWRSFNH